VCRTQPSATSRTCSIVWWIAPRVALLPWPVPLVTSAAAKRQGRQRRVRRLAPMWSNDEVDKRLSTIMKAIHNLCVRFGEQDGFINYMDGANIAAFRKVAEAMLDQGIV